MPNNRIETPAGHLVYRINGDRIEDPAGHLVYRINGSRIEDPAGHLVYYIKGNRIENPAGHLVYFMDGNQIRDPAGHLVDLSDNKSVVNDSNTPSKESKSTSSTGSAPANRSISSNGDSDGNFWLGLVIKIITNPVGLTVLGVAIFLLGIGYKESPAFLVTGLVIMGLGILWLVLRSRGARKAIAAYLPRYNEIAEALKNSGYEVAEFEHKSDHIRSSVRLNGESIGETFLVVSSWNKKMEGVLEICVGRVKGAFEKKNGKSPDGSCFYWPEDSAIGAFVEASADNWSEKQEWLSKLADIF